MMPAEVSAARVFASDEPSQRGYMRRVILFHFYDPQSQVDDYVLHALAGLRDHAAHVVVIANCPLDATGRSRLSSVSDQLIERDNVGFDVWAFKEALEAMGRERLAEFDELLLTNCTYFGPIGSFAPVFERMDADDAVDFWGLTEHAAVEPHPFLDEPRMEAHIQTHWLAVRRSVFTSEAWTSFWDQMPMTPTYLEAVSQYEARFTHYFDQAGFRHVVVFPESDYPTQHPVMDTPLLLLDDGCPIAKRRAVFREPLYLERRGISGRDVANKLAAAGYPMDYFYANLARTTKPRDLVTNLGLLEVLPDVDLGYDMARPVRVLAVLHVFYPDMTDELLDLLDNLPDGYDLVITTPEVERKEAIEKILARRGVEGEVRLVDNRGRDISAFFVGCADLIESDEHDVIVKLHSKRSPQDAAGVSEMFRRHLFENLLGSPGVAANNLRLFQQHPTLGMVFPPAYHIGYPTLGHAWFDNLKPAKREARRLRINVPFDDNTPLSAFGSMFIARPAALRPMLRGGYTYDDFPDNSGYADGALTHVVERLMSYGSLSAGMHIREVLTSEMAAINYNFLEFKHQAVAAMMPGYPDEQLAWLAESRKLRERARRRANEARKAPRQPAPLPERTTLVRVKGAVASRPVTRKLAGRPYRGVRRVYRRLRSARRLRSDRT